MARYIVLSRYCKEQTFGLWTVTSFSQREDAEAYCNRFQKRYRRNYPEFEMIFAFVPDSVAQAYDQHILAIND